MSVKMLLESQCCSCGKVELVEAEYCSEDDYGTYHICNECLDKELEEDE